MVDPSPYPGTPRWVQISTIVVGLLVVLFVVMLFTGVAGPHGPARHILPADAGGHAPPDGDR